MLQCTKYVRVLIRLLLGLTVTSVAVARSFAVSEVQGLMVADGVTGGTATPHHWVEERAYLCPIKESTGYGAFTTATPAGQFTIPGTFAPGQYGLFTMSFDSPIAFDYNTDVNLAEGQEKVQDLLLRTRAHYSVLYDRHFSEWGDDPWVQGSDIYQTFIATTRHVTRVAVKLADKDDEARRGHLALVLNVAIYEVNDGAPSTWNKISPVRTILFPGTMDPIIHIPHVTFLSREVETVPGKKYAVRFWVGDGSEATFFVIVARRDDGTGYQNGHMYRADDPVEDRDAYAYVSGGAPGTIVNFAPLMDSTLADFLGWNNRFGQTFQATGSSLAAADVIIARQQGQSFRIPIRFQVYDAVGGKPIGPAKTVHSIPGSFQARAAALWTPGQVALVPGKTYYIEGASEGCNIWGMKEDIPGVEAYIDGESKAPYDLMMSIAEYEADQAR